MDLPKFVATCIEDDEILFYGSGDTHDMAVEEFISSGEYAGYCAYYELQEGKNPDVFVYTAIDPKQSDYDKDDIDPKWTFVLDKKVETREIVTV
jgi:hypothetical protein